MLINLKMKTLDSYLFKLAVHVYMYDFWQIATINSQSTHAHRPQNEACTSLFYTFNACKIFINALYKN